jgi:hypothetical protein
VRSVEHVLPVLCIFHRKNYHEVEILCAECFRLSREFFFLYIAQIRQSMYIKLRTSAECLKKQRALQKHVK